MKNFNRTAFCGILATALGLAAQASAHVSFANGPVEQESYVVAVLQIPHGCGGKPTNEVRVKLPEGFISAKPQPKAGWDLEVIKGDYQKVYDDHGEVKSGAVEIRWKNGNLSDDFYDTFVIRGKVSGIEAGASLPFETTQLCGADGVERWNEVVAEGADPHSLKSPAPVLKIAAKQAGGHDEHAGMSMPAATAHAGHGNHDETAKLGALELGEPYTKAMLPGQPVGGGYFTIRNTGGEADTLISASSPIAGTVELHAMEMNGSVMRMRKLDKGIVIQAGRTVELKQSGLHLMFNDVTKPFRQGDSVPVTLTFEKAGTIDIILPVQAAGSAGHQHN